MWPQQDATDILSRVPTNDDYARLGVKVRARREDDLQATIAQMAAAAGGLSENTWIRIEAGKPARGLTYAGVDRALGWQPGSCRAILAGGEPTIVPPAEPAPADVDLRRAALADFPDLVALYDEMMADPRGEPADKDEVARGLLTVARHRYDQTSTGDDRRMA